MKKLLFALSLLSSMAVSAAVNMNVTLDFNNQSSGSTCGTSSYIEVDGVGSSRFSTTVELLSQSQDTATLSVILQEFTDQKSGWIAIAQQEVEIAFGQSKKVDFLVKGADLYVTIAVTKAAE